MNPFERFVFSRWYWPACILGGTIITCCQYRP